MADSSATKGADRQLVQSIERAALLLDTLAQQHGDLSLAELSERSGLHNSTAYRILATLAKHGYVRQDPRTKAYRLGFELLRLGQASRAQIDLRDETMPFLEALAFEAGELANLVVPNGFQATIIAQAYARGDRGIRMFAQLGATIDLYCTALGKSILACMPEEAVSEYLAEVELLPHTVFTITGAEELRQNLGQVRRVGYASDDQENQLGVRCIASPIYDTTGRAIAAMGISGPSGRITVQRFAELGSLVATSAHRASEHLGYQGRMACEPPAGAGDGI